MSERSRRRRHIATGLFTAASLSLAVLSVVWVARREGVSLLDVLVALPPGVHLLAFAGFALDLLSRSWRVKLLAGGLGSPVSMRVCMLSQLGGEAAGAVTPSRMGSDPAKLLVLSRAGMEVHTAAAVLVGELLAEGTGLVLLAGAVWFAFPEVHGAALGMLAYAAVVIGLSTVWLLVARLPGDREAPRFWRWLRLDADRWRRLRLLARRFSRTAAGLRALPVGTALGLVGVTLLHILARVAVLPALAFWAASGPEALSALALWPIAILYVGSLLPPPGGGGGVEFGFATVLEGTLTGGVLPAALFWWRVYTFYLGALIGGFAMATLVGRHWLRSVSPHEGPRPLRRDEDAEPERHD